jgi:predicted Fe-Mo cluster-binding NifX family protein
MNLAVTSSGPNLDDRMEARFGRCPYFILIDPDTLAFEAVENPNIALSGGAGIQSAQIMAERGVTTVLTGNCGPNAFKVFGAAGIQVVAGVDGTVREAVEKFKAGGLKSAEAPSVAAHFGTGNGGKTDAGAATTAPNAGMPLDTNGAPWGAGSGMGGGRGTGRGMGRGGGKGCGMGRGMGRGMGMMAATSPAPESGAPSMISGRSKEEEITDLKQSADDLRRRLESIQNRIEEMTKDQ